MCLLRSLVLLCAWALAAPGWASGWPLVVEALPPGVDASPEAVLAGALDDGFQPSQWAALQPDGTAVTWFRVSLASDWTEVRLPVLWVADPHGLEIDAWVPAAGLHEHGSIYGAQSDPAFSRHHLAFVMPPAWRADQPAYLRLAPARPTPRRIGVESIVELRKVDFDRARLDVLFPALQLAAVVLIGGFFISLRERVYGWFVAAMAGIVITELYYSGLGYELWPFSLMAPLQGRGLWLSLLIALGLLLGFTRAFLPLGRVAPRLDRSLQLAAMVLAVVAVAVILPGLVPGHHAGSVALTTLLLTLPLLIAGGFAVWHARIREGGFYLAAWVPGLALVAVRAVQTLLGWPLPHWLEHAVPMAFTLAALVLALGLGQHALSIRHERDEAHRLAERDGLTGILNRRGIIERLRRELVRARAEGTALSVLFLDVDHFKRINDTYGHSAGDACLRAVVAPIQAELRHQDRLGRYGGEEFLAVLPGAHLGDARGIAERIRTRAEMMKLPGMDNGLTVSIGVAALDGQTGSAEELVARADAALYRSKAGGRNRVSTHETDLQAPRLHT